MNDDDVYIDADGRRRIGRKPTPAAQQARGGGYVSPLWPPPGSPEAAHRPECGKDGRGCVCVRDVIYFPAKRKSNP